MTLSLLANVDSRYQNKELECTGLIFSFAFGFIVIKNRESKNFWIYAFKFITLQTVEIDKSLVFKKVPEHTTD